MRHKKTGTGSFKIGKHRYRLIQTMKKPVLAHSNYEKTGTGSFKIRQTPVPAHSKSANTGTGSFKLYK
jgi:hypothetical protein